MTDLIKTWRKNGFTLRLWDTGCVDSTNHTKLSYELKDRRRVIFAGDDYGVPCCHAIDGMEAVEGILVFLTLQEHDTDSEYFDKYTPDQLAWRDSARCGELNMIAFEMRERLYKRAA